MIRKLLRKLGVLKTSLTITAVAILSSVLLYLILSLIFGRFLFIGVAISAIIPCILTPLLSYFFLKVLHQLDLAEEAIRESEDRFRKLSDAAEEGIAIHDQGVIVEANEALGRIFGYESLEMIDMDAEWLVTPETYKEILGLIVSGYDKPYEGVGVRKDGSTFHCQVVGKPFQYRGKSLRVATFRDITDLKQSNGALKRSEERYKQLVDKANDIIYWTDSNGHLTFFNPTAVKIIGYSEEELLGKHYLEVIRPDYRKDAERFYGLQFVKKIPNTYYEFPTIKKNGDEIWLGQNVRLITDVESVVEFQAVARDITDRKKAEEALRESESKSRALLNAIPDLMFQMNKDGTFLNYKGARKDLYVDPELFLGKKIHDVMPPEIADLTMKHMEQALLSGDIQVYEYHLTFGDELRYFESRMVASKEDEVLTIIRDISERKLTEEDLIKSEERFRTVIEDMPALICRFLPDGTLTFVNSNYSDYFDKKNKGLIGQNFFQFVPENERDEVKNKFLSLNQKKPMTTYEHQVITPDETLRWQQWTDRAIMDEQGNVVEYQSLGRDVTDLRKAEEEKKKLEFQLRQSQKMEAIGTVASGVTHNFRNILAVISMNSQLLQVKYEDDSNLNEIADLINSHVKRGSQLIDGLMQFSRQQMNKVFQPLNLIEVIREVHELISISFDKIIDIRMNIPESIPILGDHSELSQVLMNLCTNARDAMPEGGELRIEVRKQGSNALVLLSDSGHGMNKETQERCFDPFFTTKEVDKGTGLGLSTTYGIVKEHGGEIQVSSILGQGTTFRLQFPLDLSGKQVKEEVSAKMVPGKGEKILVVDDEPAICKALKELLEGLGYNIASVNNGKDAIVKYRSWRPDAVLLDRNMPGMDGISCAEKIVENDLDAKIVVLSGYDEDGTSGIDKDKKRFIKAYLTKPIDIAELSTILARINS